MITNLLVPAYVQMLGALSSWLEKAKAQSDCGDCRQLMSARLAPDMYLLATQVRFACAQAWEGVSRLKGESLPAMVETLLDEGRNAAEDAGSFEGALCRIEETIAMLRSLTPDALDRDRLDPVAHALPNGMIFDFSAEQYARDWTLAQFYFHVLIAYAIMRQQGIDLGKGDYVGHLLQFLRPGTIPAS
jgi:hypothetical protein